jgi:DNA-binding NarL/FixJ family response regulator
MQTIRMEFPDARFVALTTAQGDVQALRALQAGAICYLLKNGLRKDLLAAIRAAHAGVRYLSPEIATELAMHVGAEALTAREINVLKTVALGQSNKEVAITLEVSEETVKAHMKSILSKLYANDRTHAVAIALKRGIISS